MRFMTADDISARMRLDGATWIIPFICTSWSWAPSLHLHHLQIHFEPVTNVCLKVDANLFIRNRYRAGPRYIIARGVNEVITVADAKNILKRLDDEAFLGSQSTPSSGRGGQSERGLSAGAFRAACSLTAGSLGISSTCIQAGLSSLNFKVSRDAHASLQVAFCDKLLLNKLDLVSSEEAITCKEPIPTVSVSANQLILDNPLPPELQRCNKSNPPGRFAQRHCGVL